MIKQISRAHGGIERMIGSGHLQKYFDNNDLVKIAEAHGDEQQQFDIYKDVLARHDFKDDFWAENYRGVINKFIEQLEMINQDIVEQIQQRRLGIQYGIPQPEPPKKPKGVIVGGHGEPVPAKKIKITQKSSTGKPYKRVVLAGSNYKWGIGQMNLLKLYHERITLGTLTTKQAITEVSDISGRSRSAVSSKYYRMRGQYVANK